jgi:hypothetical protein
MCPPLLRGSLLCTLQYPTAKPTNQTLPYAGWPPMFWHALPYITVQHFELRNLAQFIRPGDLAAGWAALGFDPINPRWGQNKITNQEGETALGGRNSVIWIDLIPPDGLNILGAPYPIVIKGRYHNGSPTPTFGYFPYAIQPHNDLLDPKGNPYLCLRSNGCHRYLRTAERTLTAAVEAKIAAPRALALGIVTT